MLHTKNLTLTIRGTDRVLLRDLNFSLQPGQKIAIIGEEGNGKSTLLKVLHDPALVEGFLEIEGTIQKGDEKTGYLPQQIPDALLEKTTAELLPMDPMLFDYTRYYRLLEEMHLPEDRIGPLPLQFLSGGEKIKFLLLRILMDAPDILLLDEPTNDLDLNSIAWLEEFLLQLDIPLLFVSHDETLLEKVSNGIVHIEQTMRRTEPQVTVSGLGYRAYAEDRLHRIERQTQLAVNEKAAYEKQMEQYRKIRDRVDHEQRVISRKNPGGGRLLKKKMHTVLSMGRRFEKEKENLTKRPDVEDSILVRFTDPVRVPAGKRMLDFSATPLGIGGRTLSESVQLTISGPQKVGIVGENGSGKTTLLRAIVKQLATGRIPFGYMPQDYMDRMDGNKTAVDFLLNGVSQADQTRVRTWLGALKFSADEMLAPVRLLSGGQRAKLYFAEMVLNDAEILVLDEPTRNLSPLSGPEVREALADYTGCIIAVSHDRKFLDEVCDTLYHLDAHGLHQIR